MREATAAKQFVWVIARSASLNFTFARTFAACESSALQKRQRHIRQFCG